MYTKAEVSKQRQKFWTRFGQYMAPVPSAEGEKINWINYKTGVKHFQFRMDVTSKMAALELHMSFPDIATRQQVYDRLLQLKLVFEGIAGEHWHWHPLCADEHGKTYSKLSRQLAGVNIFDESTWPEIISFLKENIIALDAFWSQVKEGFTNLS